MQVNQRTLSAKAFCAGLALFLCGAAAVEAHVAISPAQSKLGKQESYTLTVPTEGTSATTAVVLDVPPGVTIVSVGASSAEYTLAKENGRITSITWQVNIPQGGGKELTFVAQNPLGPPNRISWNVHQLFADGSRSDWIDPPPAKPAPTTRLSGR